MLDYATGELVPVALAKFSSPIEANLAAAMLSTADIHCALEGGLIERNNLGLAPAGGITLLVPRRDLANAIAILADTPAREALIVQSDLIPPAEPRPIRPLKCPRCGSARTGARANPLWLVCGAATSGVLMALGRTHIVAHLAVAATFLLAWWLTRPTRCLDCGLTVDLDDIGDPADDSDDASIKP